MQKGRTPMQKHEITRIRKDVVRRTLRVAAKEYITPRMLRIVFQSDDLQGFDSPSPDDHIKIFLPSSGDEKPISRDFTPRTWDHEAGTFTIDFALHEVGRATEWARAAKAGDRLEIGGPRGSTVVADDFDWYLLIGDATALPSIGRRLERMRPGVVVDVFALIPDSEERQEFVTSAHCNVHWLLCSGSSLDHAATLRSALETFRLRAGDGFVWMAAEASVSRDLYTYLVEIRGHPKQWVKAAAYWTEPQFDSREHSN
jgi:NADPH-dependent ferric siderophore reductase